MPTIKQLNELWASDFEHNLRQQETDDGYAVQGAGKYKPLPPENNNHPKGEIIGHYEYVPEHDDFKIVLHDNQKPSE